MISLLGVYPNELKTYVYALNIYPNVYNSFIYYQNELETPKILDKIWIKILVHPYKGICSEIKR